MASREVCAVCNTRIGLSEFAAQNDVTGGFAHLGCLPPATVSGPPELAENSSPSEKEALAGWWALPADERRRVWKLLFGMLRRRGPPSNPAR